MHFKTHAGAPFPPGTGVFRLFGDTMTNKTKVNLKCEVGLLADVVKRHGLRVFTFEPLVAALFGADAKHWDTKMGDLLFYVEINENLDRINSRRDRLLSAYQSFRFMRESDEPTSSVYGVVTADRALFNNELPRCDEDIYTFLKAQFDKRIDRIALNHT